MTKINDIYSKMMKTIIVITLYFIWPSVIKFINNIVNINPNEIVTFACNIVLLVIIVLIYLKDIISSLNNISIKKLICLFLSLIGVQILTNLISIAIIGVDNRYTYGGLLPAYLEKWPVLMGISVAIIYPILETLVFNTSLKDIINSKWTFIICSSLFFWLVNILAVNVNSLSIIATMSCFTTSIVINYFYYKEDNISSIIIVKMIYNLIFLLLP